MLAALALLWGASFMFIKICVRELEVVRVAVEQPADAVELLVGQPQRTVERLFRHDLRQGIECSGGRRWAGATLDPS